MFESLFIAVIALYILAILVNIWQVYRYKLIIKSTCYVFGTLLKMKWQSVFLLMFFIGQFVVIGILALVIWFDSWWLYGIAVFINVFGHIHNETRLRHFNNIAGL